VSLTPENREKLRQVSISTLTTCLFTRGFRNVWIRGAVPLGGAAPRMVGEAFTLRFIPSREDLDTMAAYASNEHVQRRAIEECPKGAVLVIDSRGRADAASAGDIMLARLQVRGAAGAVTDGGFRDCHAIAQLNFPAYHVRPAPPSSPIVHHAADLNLPIGCGEVAVYPGDIVVGDSEGVVVVPLHIANEAAEAAFEMTRYETFAEEKIREGRPLFGTFPASAESRADYEKWLRGRPA
jgi:regulator of RNase E activity RraA